MLSKPDWFVGVLANHLLELILSEVTVKALHAQDCILCIDTLLKCLKEKLDLVALGKN